MLNVSLTAKVLDWGELTTEMNIPPILIPTERVHYSPQVGYYNKREIQFLLIATQNNAIRTNYVKARIDTTQRNHRCRLCSDRDETINHIINESSKLVQKRV